jgi:membrane protein YqaA with SNARE-associated domain
VILGPIAALHKLSSFLLKGLKPFGIWGVGGLALIDSALIPIPVSMDAVVVGYVAQNRHYMLLFCLMAAAASAIGSLVPFYIGRAGGELFLLKRINRERYEKIRDKFERQEFVAIMVPAMLPPPTPMKLFEFAAGVFEMKPLPFLLAIFVGKMVQFVVCSLLFLWFGMKLVHTAKHMIHAHLSVVIGIVVAIVFAAVFYFVRKLFDGRKGEKLPAE